MSLVTHKFGTIEVTIKDDKTNLEIINQLAYNTLLLLIPVAERMLIAESKLCAEQCSEQDDEEDGSPDAIPPKKDAMFV